VIERPSSSQLVRAPASRQSSPLASRQLTIMATPACKAASVTNQPPSTGERAECLYPGTSIRVSAVRAPVATPPTETPPRRQDRRKIVATAQSQMPRHEHEIDTGGQQRRQLSPRESTTRHRSASPRGHRATSYGREPDTSGEAKSARHHRPDRRLYC